MARKRHVEWLEDYEQCSAWMSKYNCAKLLKKGRGLAKISNFLPEFVAEGILKDLEQVPDKAWNATAATDNLSYNNISHSFQSIKNARGLERALRALTLLLPDSLNSFSAAKYTQTDHIAPHDDRAYTQVRLEDGSVILTSRTVALIVYLTKEWREEFGGLLVDMEHPSGSHTYVPEFNSAILFRIPRWHQVTAMATTRPRYTLFGWFLEPGELYPLNLGSETGPPTSREESRAEQASQGRTAGQQHETGGMPRKRRRKRQESHDPAPVPLPVAAQKSGQEVKDSGSKLRTLPGVRKKHGQRGKHPVLRSEAETAQTFE